MISNCCKSPMEKLGWCPTCDRPCKSVYEKRVTSIKPGKKMRRNQRINRTLKSDGIAQELSETCELRLEGCVGSRPPLDWAHSSRRSGWSKSDTGKHLLAALSCRVCHNRSDAMSDHGEAVILAAISRRDNRVENNYE